MTISSDITNVNGPGHVRTQSANLEKQVCYFGERKNDELYKIFNSERIKAENFNKGIYFKIFSVQSRANLETFSAHNILQKYGSGTIGLCSTNKKRGDSTDESR